MLDLWSSMSVGQPPSVQYGRLMNTLNPPSPEDALRDFQSDASALGQGPWCPVSPTPDYQIPRGGDRVSSQGTESMRSICPSILSQPDLFFAFCFLTTCRTDMSDGTVPFPVATSSL